MSNPDVPLPSLNDGARNWWRSRDGVLLLAAITSSAVAWWLIAFPVATMRVVARHADHFPPLYVHMLGGTIMLTCGAANLYVGATRRYFAWHAWIGRTYLVGGGIGALMALALALGPAHPLAAHPPWSMRAVTNVGISIGTLAVAWIVASTMAYRAIRNRRIAAHRDWMIRSYVLVWSFVFCRLASRVPAIGDLGGGEAFIWLSWVGPLVLCEVALQWRSGGAAQPVAR
jgi:hypothetical protein